jgi:hypothetical protein
MRTERGKLTNFELGPQYLPSSEYSTNRFGCIRRVGQSLNCTFQSLSPKKQQAKLVQPPQMLAPEVSEDMVVSTINHSGCDHAYTVSALDDIKDHFVYVLNFVFLITLVLWSVWFVYERNVPNAHHSL